MFFSLKGVSGSRHAVAAVALTATPLLLGGGTAAHAQMAEVIVKITQVRALDTIDAASPADFMARVTLAGGQPCSTTAIKDQNEIRPTDWVCRWTVPHGIHNVTIDLADKDVSVNDPIDINRLPNKRNLDFQVNTRNCNVRGFSQGHSCGDRITRSGDERKKAEITFVVEVERRR